MDLVGKLDNLIGNCAKIPANKAQVNNSTPGFLVYINLIKGIPSQTYSSREHTEVSIIYPINTILLYHFLSLLPMGPNPTRKTSNALASS